MSKAYKTSQKKRTNYIYYPAKGGQIVIRPGENSVTEADIALSHSIDDNEIDAHNRYVYKISASLDAYQVGENEYAYDRNIFLLDNTTNPEKLLIETEEEAEHLDLLDKLSKAMEHLEDKEKDLINKKFVGNKTNVAIAAEWGVSETTIRKHLKKLYKKLKNILIND